MSFNSLLKTRFGFESVWFELEPGQGGGAGSTTAPPDVARLTGRVQAGFLPWPPLSLPPSPRLALMTLPLPICTVAAGGAQGSVGGASAGKASELSRDSYGDERDRDIDREREGERKSSSCNHGGQKSIEF